MNTKNQHTQPIQKIASGLKPNPPKLTVQAIVEKFVKPSTHRKLIVLSEPVVPVVSKK